MKREFVELTAFSKRVDRESQEVLRAIQNAILKNPEAGDIIQGTGGLRKIRIGDPGRGKGKRGGFRAIYLDLPDIERTYLFLLYDKDERVDISPDEKRILRTKVAILKKEAD